VTEIIADEVEFVNIKKADENGEKKAEMTLTEVDDETLPF
jgi:hypothetical protein